MKYALWIIAACHLATTLDVYTTEDNGLTFFVGNFGYHIAQGEN